MLVGFAPQWQGRARADGAASAPAASCAARRVAIRTFARQVFEMPRPYASAGVGPLQAVDRPPAEEPLGPTGALPRVSISREGVRIGDSAETTAGAIRAGFEKGQERERQAAIAARREPAPSTPVVLEVAPDAPVSTVRVALEATIGAGVDQVFFAFDVSSENTPQPSDPALVRQIRASLVEAGHAPYPTRDGNGGKAKGAGVSDGRTGWLSERSRAASARCPGLSEAAVTCGGLGRAERGPCYGERISEAIVACGCTANEERFLALIYVSAVPERPLTYLQVRLAPTVTGPDIPAGARWADVAPQVLAADPHRFWLGPAR